MGQIYFMTLDELIVESSLLIMKMRKSVLSLKNPLLDEFSYKCYVWRIGSGLSTAYYLYGKGELDSQLFYFLETRGYLRFTGKHWHRDKICDRFSLAQTKYPDDKIVPMKRKIPRRIRERVLNEYNYQCANCGATYPLHIDHIYPISKGGTNEYENLQVLCSTCNIKKSNKII